MSNLTSPMASGQLSAYKEPTMWEDLKDSEKIERLREIIKQNQASYARQLKQLSEMVEKLKQHTHSGDKICVPIDRNFGYLEGCAEAKRSDGKSYF